MRLFRVNEGRSFTEYRKDRFDDKHVEETLESWLEANPHCVLEDSSLLILGRQVAMSPRSYVDLLGLDREGNVVVVELKRGRTPRDTLAQALEYASFAADLDVEQLEELARSYLGEEAGDLTAYHRAAFELEDAGLSFNKEQRIVIVGQDISPEVVQTSTYLRRRGVRVTCLEFSYFTTDAGEQLFSTEIIVGREAGRGSAVSGARLPTIDKAKFLESCDEGGRVLFSAILELADAEGLAVHWGSKGFSLNADLDGVHVPLCYVYPPIAVYKQSIYTAFADIVRKVEGAEGIVDSFSEEFAELGFVPAGKWKERKILVDRTLSDVEIRGIRNLLAALAKRVADQGSTDA